MGATIQRMYYSTIHPAHAALLAGTVPLFLGAALSDIAYASTYEIQWANFASWLIVGGLVLAGLALLFAVIELSQRVRRTRVKGVYAALLLTTWVLGFFNALMHARDAWAMMPAGLVLSILVVVLAVGATWIGFSAPRIEERV